MTRFIKVLSVFLVVVLLVNMLPLGIMAQELQQKPAATISADSTATVKPADAQILAEIPEKRTEYSKEFLLSNGLHMATVYANAVHYRTDKGWEDIDNTLVARNDGTYAASTGDWSVVLPQELTKDKLVTVSLDGYSISFRLDGQIKNTAALLRTSDQPLLTTRATQAIVRQPRAMLEEMGLHADKTTPQKLHSRLTYNGVFENTDVMYDLDSYAVKESIVLQRFDAALSGYRYTLYTGNLTPVMDDTGHIDLYAPNGKIPVMSLPSPYLVDNAGAYCDQVQVSLTGGNGEYTMTYVLPQQWLSAQDRAWPVILDPVVKGSARTQNIQDRTISEKMTISVNKSLFYAGYADNHGKIRGFLQYNALPQLTSSDVVINATFGLYKIVNSSPAAPVEIHKVNGQWTSVDITWENQPAFDPIVVDYSDVGSKGYYYWNITDLVNDWYTEVNNGLMIKMSDAVENGTTDRFRQFYSVEAGTSYRPKLEIVFRNNNGLESYWDYTSASAGRAGTGYVNNFTGNLIWTRSDLGFGGNRMPVSITHVYNLNDSTVPEDTDNNAVNTSGNYFGMGNGWRTNLSQRVFQWSENSSYYVWEDADGTDIYFKKTATSKYTHEDDPNIILKTNGSGTKRYQITDQYGNITYFDTKGRLTEIRNNQSTTSSITVTYTASDSQLISTVCDGVGRRYQFTYTSSKLTRIGYYGTGTTELAYVAYSYDSEGNLTGITDKDGKTCTYTYTGHVLTAAEDIDGYKLSYTYNIPEKSFQPYRVVGVAAYDGSAAGGSLTFAYSRNQTVLTDHNGSVRIYQFNDFGHTVSVQDDEGRAQFSQYPFFTDAQRDDNTDDTKHKNLLTQASKMQNTVSNLLSDSSFENGTVWHPPGTTAYSNSVVTTQSYHGSKALSIQHGGGAIIQPLTAQNKPYTFSAYVKTTGAQARIAISVNGAYSYSEYLPANSDWTRLEVSCQGAEDALFVPVIETLGSGYTYVDCVQLESAPTASRYNLIQNSDFNHVLDGWNGTHYTVTTAGGAAAPQLDNHAVSVTGDYQTEKALSQTVSVSGNAGDTLVLTGWAKADSVALGQSYHTQSRQFAITGVFTYTDGTQSDPFPVTFNPDAGSELRWQFSAAPMVAKKAYSAVTVSIHYDYNMNTALFDGIGLYKEEFGASYTYDESGNIISVVDLEKQETTYEYDTDNNLTKIVQGDKIKMTYSYDAWHNVTTATTEEGQLYEFTYDVFGNNTHVSITADGLTMESSAAYTADGNRLVSSTDALGKVTTYTYDADTNLLNAVKYPEDTDETKTTYTYDSMYRLARTEAAIGEGSAAQTLYATYTYEDDLLKSIATPTTTYSFTYGEFGTRTNVQVGARILAAYSYTPDQNRYLEAMTYGNGDRVEYGYDSKGRLIRQTYEDGDTVTYQYDNNGALATVTDSATGITVKYYYDFTDRLLAYEENSDDYSLKTGYTYDLHNNLTEVSQTVNGATHVTSYTYNEDNRLTSMTADGVTVEYTYDGFGRLTGQVTKKDGGAVLTETFTYTTVDGKTSSQIAGYSTVTAAGTTAYSYTYDGNGNILSVSDGVNTTSYVYDSQNQLIRENNQAGNFTHTWSYDNAGNILVRTEYAYTTGNLGTPTDTVTYTYGDDDWGDLLTAYDGVGITYDEIGNPLNDGTRTYTWEHGREMATVSMGTDTWTNTYNADGLRIRRTNGSKTYSYIYTGSTLTQMTVGSDTLYFTYDASGIPLTVTHNGTTYYYATNLQGDITAILDANGATVVTYTYDAWGNPLTTTGAMASTLGAVNPLRYRGYVYDAETGLYYLQSRYYNPEIGRFINADIFIATGQGFVGNNAFAYCLNNPAIYLDRCGSSATPIPMIENGLNLPASGGVPVVINGTTYFYAIGLKGGYLQEYWFDSDGNLIWARHHTDHRTPWNHEDPHDHRGTKDDKGNNTIEKGPLPVDDDFHNPYQHSKTETTKPIVRHKAESSNTEYVVAGVVVGYLVYQAVKWSLASFLAPMSLGSSYAVAAATP